MEITIPIKIKLNKEAEKIPNCDDSGNIQEGFWDKEAVEKHFGESFAHFVKRAIEKENFGEGYMSDVGFENIEEVKDLERVFGFEVFVGDEKVDFKSTL